MTGTLYLLKHPRERRQVYGEGQREEDVRVARLELCLALDDLGLDTPSPEEKEPERGRTRKHKHLESYRGAFEAGDEYKGTKRVSLHTI